MLNDIKKIIVAHKLNIIAFVIIALVVMVGNAIYVTGLRDPNPLLQHSGLASESYSTIIAGKDTIDPNNAFTSQALGKLAANMVFGGDMPYWNHFEGIGMPLLGEMQSAALLPLTLLLSLPNGLLISHMILELIAGIFTYLFLRKLGLSWYSSLAGATFFALNGTFAWLTNAAFNPIAFLPMLMYGIEVAYSHTVNNRRLGWAWIAISIAFSLYAGFPETAFINTIFAGVWVLARLFTMAPKFRRNFIIKLLIGGLLGLALATPPLVAFLGFLTDSNIGGHSDSLAHASLSAISLPAHFMPYIYGTIFAYTAHDLDGNLTAHWGSIGGYFTISVLVLALIGIKSNLHKPLKIALLAWLVLGFFKMFGFDLAELVWNLVPTIKNAAFYRYITPSLSFAFVILAAFGFDRLSSKGLPKRATLILLAASIITIVIMAYIAKSELNLSQSAPYYRYFMVLSVLWAISIITLILGSKTIIKKRYFPQVLFAIVLLDVMFMYTVPQLSTPKVKTDQSAVQFLQENIGYSRFYTLGPIAPNYGSYFKIASINQNDLPVSKSWSDYIVNNLDKNTDPILFVGYFRIDKNGTSAFEEFARNQKNFSYVGVKYLVTAKNQLSATNTTETKIKKVFTSSNIDIYELPEYHPFISPSSNCMMVSTESRDSMSVNCEGEGYIVRRTLWIDGWRATVNGDQVEIHKENDIFQKINLPAGASEIKYQYNPPFITFSYIVFLLSLIMLVIPYLLLIIKRVKSKSSTIKNSKKKRTSN